MPEEKNIRQERLELLGALEQLVLSAEDSVAEQRLRQWLADATTAERESLGRLIQRHLRLSQSLAGIEEDGAKTRDAKARAEARRARDAERKEKNIKLLARAVQTKEAYLREIDQLSAKIDQLNGSDTTAAQTMKAVGSGGTSSSLAPFTPVGHLTPSTNGEAALEFAKSASGKATDTMAAARAAANEHHKRLTELHAVKGQYIALKRQNDDRQRLAAALLAGGEAADAAFAELQALRLT